MTWKTLARRMEVDRPRSVLVISRGEDLPRGSWKRRITKMVGIVHSMAAKTGERIQPLFG